MLSIITILQRANPPNAHNYQPTIRFSPSIPIKIKILPLLPPIRLRLLKRRFLHRQESTYTINTRHPQRTHLSHINIIKSLSLPNISTRLHNRDLRGNILTRRLLSHLRHHKLSSYTVFRKSVIRIHNISHHPSTVYAARTQIRTAVTP